jgi:hypothetical protein
MTTFPDAVGSDDDLIVSPVVASACQPAAVSGACRVLASAIQQ